MPTRYQVEQILKEEFITNFDTTVPVCFENRDSFWLCTSPLTVTTKPSDSNWVRFYIVNNDSYQVTFASSGNRTFNRYGLIVAQVNYPQGSGIKNAKNQCEDIIDIFEGKRISSIYCNSGTYQEQGIQDDGFYMVYVTIPFDFDTRK